MGIRPRHLFAPLFVIVCGYLLYAIYDEVRERTLETARTAQQVRAVQAAHGIEGFFDQYTGMLDYLASLDPVVRLGPDGEALLAAFLEHSADLTAITRMDASGRILFTSPANPAALGADISQQTHVRTLLATRQPVVSDVFHAVQGYRTVALHVPVFEDGGFRGSVAALIPFDVLARNFLQALGVGASGHAWLLNQHGTELYCDNPHHVGRRAEALPIEPSHRELTRRMVAGEQGAMTCAGSTHLGPQAEAGGFVVAYVPVPVVDTAWSIAVAASEAEILEAARVFRDQWMAVVGALGIGLLLYALGAVRTRSVLREAAARKRAASVLQASYETVRTILDGLGAEVYVADLESHEILFMNQRMRENFGAELEGKLCWKEFQGGAGPCSWCTNERLLDAEGKPAGVVTWEGRDPLTRRWCLNHDQAIRWADGRLVHLHMATDITDRKQAEEFQQRVEKLESLGVLAGGIAHDFNNLLTGILGNLSLARLRAATEANLAALLDETEQAAVRAAALTRQLLTFAKGGAPIKQLTSVADLVREASDFALRGSKTRAEFDLAAGLWAAEVDPGQISQVIHNLVLNADQAMLDGGVIQVSIHNVMLDGREPPLPKGPYLEIVIRDEGMGIAPENLPRIFDPYFTTKGHGSGLGLASSHSIVRRHDGHIGVVSRPGEGTCFTLYLPAAPAARPAVAAAAAAPRPQVAAGRDRILVMDDEEMIRDVAQAMLEALGFRSAVAADGAEAVDLYRQALQGGTPFAAVLLDLTVPGGMGGEETLRQLVELDPQVVAVVSSGYAADTAAADPAARGFAGRLTKPYSVQDLQRVLGEVLSEVENG